MLEGRTLLTVTPSGGLASWIEQGPGPIFGTSSQVNNDPGHEPTTGAVNVLAPDPSNHDILYAGSVNGGIWKTTNATSLAGPTWTALTDQSPSLSIAALTFDPGDPGRHTLWAGVGRRSSLLVTGRKTTLAGILRTTDDGQNWQVISPDTFLSREVTSIVAIDPALTPNQHVIVVGASGGMFRSTDGGQIWTNVSGTPGAPSLPQAAPTDIVAGVGTTLYAAFPNQGVFRSADGGATWSPANGDLPAGTAAKGVRVRLSTHVVVNSEVLYAGFANSPLDASGKPQENKAALDTVFRSTDGGAHWVSMNHPSTIEGGKVTGLHSENQADTHFSLVADPADPNVVYVGGDTGNESPFLGRIFRGVFANGTASWTLVVKGGANNTSPHPDSRNLVFDPADPNRLLECDDGGVFVLDNPSFNSRKWESLDGDLGTTEITFAAYDPIQHTIVAGFQDNGSGYHNPSALNGPTAWTELSGGDGGVVQVGIDSENQDGIKDAVYFTNTQFLDGLTRTGISGSDGVVLSSETVPQKVIGTGDGKGNLDSITALEKRLPGGSTVQFTNRYALNVLDPQRLLIGTRHLYESSDDGKTFTVIGGFKPGTTIPTLTFGVVNAIAYGGKENGAEAPDIAYVGTFDKDTKTAKVLLRSTAGGTFDETAYPGGNPKKIALDPDNWRTAYVLDADGKVFRTADAGAHWTDVSGNLPRTATPMLGLAVFPRTNASNDEVVLVGGYGGVFRAQNPTAAQVTWGGFGQELPNVIVSELVYNAADDVLVATTLGRGAWIVNDAAALITAPTALQVDGTGGNDTITLIRSKDRSRLLDVIVNGTKEGTFPVDSIDTINVNGAGGTDTLTIDEANGAIDNSINSPGITPNRVNGVSGLVKAGKDIVDGLKSAVDWIQGVLGAGAGSTPLPGTGTSVGDALTGGGKQAELDRGPAQEEEQAAAINASSVDGEEKEEGSDSLDEGTVTLRSALVDQIVARVRDYLALTSNATAAGLAKSLGGLSVRAGDVLLSVDPSSVSGTQSGNLASVTLTLHAKVGREVVIDLGGAGESLGLKFDADGAVDLEADMDFRFTFGFDLTPGLSPLDAFFLHPESLTVGAEANAPDLNFEVDLGFLKAEVDGGTVDVGASLTADFHGAGNLTRSQLLSTNFATAVTFAAAGDVHIDLPVTASLAGLNSGGAAHVKLDDDNVFDATPPTLQTPDLQNLLDFQGLTPQTVLGVLGNVATFLQSFRGSAVFAAKIPFSGGHTLGDALDVSKSFLDKVNAHLKDADGNPTFDDVVSFSEELASAFGIDASVVNAHYDQATHSLIYHLDFGADSAASFPLALGGKVGALASIQASGMVHASAHADAGLDFGVHLADLATGSSPADAFFLANAAIDGSVNFALTGASASAVFGPIALHAGSAAASGSAHAGIQLAAGKQATLHQLFDALAKPADLAALVTADVGGDAHLSLHNISVDAGLFTLSGDPALTIDVADIVHPDPQLSFNSDFNPLKQFQDMDFGTVVGALKSVLAFLKMLSSQPFMQQKLPFANRSLADLVAFTDKFSKFLDQLEANPAATLQEVSGKINKALSDALGVPQQDFVTLEIDGDALKVDLDFQTGFHAALPIDVDLASLAGGAPGIGNIANLSGSGTLHADVDAGLNLDLGIDLSDPAHPRPFVYGDTGLGINDAMLSGTNLDFSATVGPLGIFVKNGNASLGPIDFNFTADANDADHRFFFDAGLPSFSPSLSGGASLNLPLFFPDVSTPIGNPNALKITIGNIADIGGTTTVVAPDLSGIANALDLTSNLGALVNGIDRLLGWLHDALNDGLFGKELPIVGKNLKTADAAAFIQQFRSQILSKLKGPNGTSSAAAVQTELFDVLKTGLGILGDRNKDGQVTKDDIEVVAAPDDVHFNLLLAKQVTLLANDPTHPVGFDIGVPGLGLSVETNVKVVADFGLKLGFGVSRSDGFYFVDAGPDLFHVGIDLSTPGINAQGHLAFLNLTATDPNNTTHFGGSFDVSLKDPNHDGKITLAEVSAIAANPTGLIDAKLTGDAHVGLHLLLNVGAAGSPSAMSFPSIESDFALDWHFGAAPLAGELFGDAPTIHFNDVKLNFGDFVTKFAGPILHDIQKVLEPLQPIVDVLTARLPVLSDLAGHDVTLIDLAGLFGGGAVDVEFIKVIVKVVQLVKSIPTVDPGQQLFINFGSFEVGGDLRTQKSTDIVVPNLPDLSPGDIAGDLSGNGDAASFVAGFDTSPGHGLEFPLLKSPASIFKLLLGQDVPLFTFDLPTLKFGFGFSQFFTIFGPLGVQLSGDVGVTIHAAFGYDTKGLSEFAHDIKAGNNGAGELAGDLLDGFFISTRTNPDGTGDPAHVVTLHAGIEAFASINLGIAAAGVGGGIFADIGLGLHDPNDDGKLRLGEIGSILENSPLCLFEVDGKLTAGLTAFVRFLFFEKHFDIAEITLLSFHAECEDNPPPPPTLATLMPDGTLFLNMGTRAAQRVTGDLTDGDENFTVTHVSGSKTDETVSVTAFGFTQQFEHVKNVIGHGGQGNDTILLQGVLAPAGLTGDAGDDHLAVTKGAGFMDGGAGNDSLTGGSEADLMTGGAGDDILDGADGNDTLDGGDGNNQIRGGGGDDTITVTGTGSNDLDGGDGNDTITAADGPDVIIGRAGNDNITAGDGADAIEGDEGDDSIDAGAGDDHVEGGIGNDTVHGGAGADDIDAGEGDDTVFAEAGNDHVEGGIGNDHVEAGAGDDAVGAGEGNDFVDGGTGSDTIEGEDGDDTLLGNDGNDTIDGGEGEDSISGGDGRDVLKGGEDNDTVAGDGGDDVIDGELGNDVLTGGDGNDALSGNAGDDSLDGQAGDDLLRGGDGADTLAGGTGNDVLFGDNDNDTLSGNADNDQLHGGAGDDTLSGNAGDDTLFGDAGNDHADGNEGNDTVFGNAGTDVVLGSGGDDVLSGGQGDDLVDGGDGNDLMFGDDGAANPDGSPNRADSATDGKDLMTGGAGNDTMFGQGGDDDMFGNAGNDTMYGDAGDDDMVGGSGVAGALDGDDTMDGGAGNDVIAGDNALIVRRGDTLSPLFRTLIGATMYNPYNSADNLVDGAAAVTGSARGNPRGVAGRDVTLFDHSSDAAATAGKFGNDNIAGGAGDDMIFAQLGNDTVQGDASVTETVSAIDPSAEAATDGNDYVEGNGGNDLVFGNGGQDDLIGGSSSLFGLTTAAQRPDGADTIFGGAGTHSGINDAGDSSAAGHAADADVIIGDNGNIYRLVKTGATALLQFNYDNYGAVKIIPRAVDLLDYTPDGNPANDVGGGDVIHGDAGDDFIHGASGDDKLYGDGQDDDLYGEGGNDWISGGAGDDGVLGDDGKLFTSRNGTAEPLYGIAATTQQSVTTNGNVFQAVLDPTGRLKKTVDLEPFSIGGNDTIYGGLGNDSLHGGAGDDAISGAEALAGFFNNPASTPVLTFNNATGRFDLLNLNAPMAKVNGHPLNFLAFNANNVPIDDGQDVVFGDDGNDWLVGGTNSDHIYGGRGNDVLNADDNLETNGGANNAPDTGVLFSSTDIAYGGGGRDALIGNSTNDRLTDWVGEFNNYNVPFSQFGNNTVNRQILPGLVDFLLKLSKSDGADQTRVGSGLGTAARNGEPFGELGMFLQQDAGWTDQTGAPTGPQPQ